MATEFLIGCDPEVFVTRRGKPSSAYGLLEGTKESPFKTKGGAYQVDGMAAEFNTDPVQHRNAYGHDTGLFELWNNRIIGQIKAIRSALPKDRSLRIAPTMEFGKEFLEQQPREARELGCDPDYSAYTLQPNPKPKEEATFRTGAGHIHVGWGADIPTDNKEHMEICAGFIRMMDATVGMFMTFVDRDPLRRELYGKAGAMRPKPYGVEYRTPSNVWIQNRDMRLAVWHLTGYAIKYHKAGSTPLDVAGTKAVRRIIDEGDHQAALAALSSVYRKASSFIHYYGSGNVYPPYMRRIIQRMENNNG